jgi:pimeloyl-ACP methyl ester carboxylesterase
MRLAAVLQLCATLISAHRISHCTTTRASASPVARRAAVSCQVAAAAAANACVEATANPLIAYEMVQGTDVVASSGRQHPPTCLLTHGILGSRRNLKSFAQRMALQFPEWQFLLVDLRCHGQSSARSPAGPNTVEAAALDVIALLNHLKIYPVMLMGHSFGGKVVMSMVQQSGRVMPRPVQVWVLDTVPGDVWCDGGDHPRDTIRFVSTLEPPFTSRKQLIDELTGEGFTPEGAQWMATNLKPAKGGQLDWTFDLKGINELYGSYELCDLWPMLETQPKGLQVLAVAVVAGGWWAVGGGRWAVGAAAVVAARMSSACRWTLCARSALRLCGLRTTWSESTGTARASTFCLMPHIGCTSTTPKANQPVKSGLLVAPQLGSPVSAAEPAELLRALERRAGAAQVSTRRLPCRQRARQSLELSPSQHPGLLEMLAPSFAQMAR